MMLRIFGDASFDGLYKGEPPTFFTYVPLPPMMLLFLLEN